MMQQYVTGVVVRDAKILTNDSVSSKGGLQNVAFEPRVKEFINRAGDKLAKIKIIQVGLVGSLQESNFVHKVWGFKIVERNMIDLLVPKGAIFAQN